MTMLVIRISGLVEVPDNVDETLFRMRLRRKFSAVLLHENVDNRKLIRYVRDFVAYGDVSKEVLIELLMKRGVMKNKKKIDLLTATKLAEQLDKKSMEELGLKPFFRLAPAVGGIDSKIHFGRKKGVLGDNGAKINELVRRML